MSVVVGSLAFGTDEVEAMAEKARRAIDLQLARRWPDGISHEAFWAIVAKAYVHEGEADGPGHGRTERDARRNAPTPLIR